MKPELKLSRLPRECPVCGWQLNPEEDDCFFCGKYHNNLNIHQEFVYNDWRRENDPELGKFDDDEEVRLEPYTPEIINELYGDNTDFDMVVNEQSP